MPGSGKTTIGKIVANALDREFYDTDEEFVKSNGVIADYFKSNGEKSFRDKESEIVSELGAKNGLVIATGGGAILRAENVKHLKQNGIVFFLDREVETRNAIRFIARRRISRLIPTETSTPLPPI